MAADLYEKDYYAWANDTAQAIRSGAFSRIDKEVLADEVADMARREKRSLRSRMELLIAHLLKWDYQAGKRTRSWAATVAVQRSRANKLLDESPSLLPWLTDSLAEIYEIAVQLAVKDTDLSQDSFPRTCPYTLHQILREKEVRPPMDADLRK